MKIKLLLLLCCTATCINTSAQIEVVHVKTTGISATGYSIFLNHPFRIYKRTWLTFDAAFSVFTTPGTNSTRTTTSFPVAAGIRQMLFNRYKGPYLEPFGGYSLGYSEVPRKNWAGYAIYDRSGRALERAVKGPTVGINAGYILNIIPINVGIRLRRVFVKEDANLDLYSFRATYAFGSGRKKQ